MGTHLAPQRQNGFSISRRRRRLLREEPVAPLIHVPSSVDTSGMCGVHRQVAQRHVPQERCCPRRTDLGRIRLVRGNDASSIAKGSYFVSELVRVKRWEYKGVEQRVGAKYTEPREMRWVGMRDSPIRAPHQELEVLAVAVVRVTYAGCSGVRLSRGRCGNARSRCIVVDG